MKEGWEKQKGETENFPSPIAPVVLAAACLSVYEIVTATSKWELPIGTFVLNFLLLFFVCFGFFF